jgi:hypothetical protein
MADPVVKMMANPAFKEFSEYLPFKGASPSDIQFAENLDDFPESGDPVIMSANVPTSKKDVAESGDQRPRHGSNEHDAFADQAKQDCTFTIKTGYCVGLV